MADGKASASSLLNKTMDQHGLQTSKSPGVWYLCPNTGCNFKADTLQILGQHLDNSCKFAANDPNQTIVYQCPNKGCDFKSNLPQLSEHVNAKCKFGLKKVPEASKVATANGSATTASPVQPPVVAAPVSKQVVKPSVRKAICTICTHPFDDSQKLIEHMSTVHKMRASYKCSTCAKPFPTKEAVEKHIVEVHGSKGKKDSLNTSMPNGGGGQTPKSPEKGTFRPGPESAMGANVQPDGQKRNSPAKSPLKNGNINSNISGSVPSANGQALSENNANSHHVDNGFDNFEEVDFPEQLVTEPDLPPPMELNESYGDEMDDLTKADTLHCLTCGLEFHDREELGRHEMHCPSDTQMHDSADFADISANLTPSGSSHYFKHFKHEHINLVSDSDNVYCKSCMKKFQMVHGLCNHLCRRLDCREWYCQNLHTELRSADERRKRLGLPKPPPLPRRGAWRYEAAANAATATNRGFSRPYQAILPKTAPTVSAAVSGGYTSSVSSHATPKRAAAIASETRVKMSIIGLDDYDTPSPNPSPQRKQLPLSDRLLRCGKCKKIFGGKSPWVAFRNHLRGSKSCSAYSMKAEVIVQQNVVSAFQKQYTGGNSGGSQPIAQYRTVIAPTVAPQRQIAPKQQEMGPLPPPEAIAAGTKYFCKLCPKRDIKNRVSLGCHLTIYHGLPQVNCDNGKGEAFRCQNCSKIFTTKYYYNCHRKECDLSSPYVGVIDEQGNVVSSSKDINMTPQKRAEIEKHTVHSGSVSTNTSTPSQQNMVPSAAELRILNNPTPSTFFTNRYKCSLCNRHGFWGPNAVKIHQKYQCVNREMVQAANARGIAPSRLKNIVPRMKSAPYQLPIHNRLQSYNNGGKGDSDVNQNRPIQINELARTDPSMRKCEDCGKGPYNSYYYYIEHKKSFCKGPTATTSHAHQAQSDKHQSMRTYSMMSRGRTSPSQLDDGTDETALSVALVLPQRAGKTTTQKRPYVAPSATVTSARYSQAQRARKSMGNSAENGLFMREHYGEEPMTTGHDEEEDDEEAIPEMPEYTDQIIKCLECTTEFESLDVFVRHRLKHINDYLKDKEKNESSGEVVCEICSGTILDQQRMQSHLMLHLQNYMAYKNRQLAELKRRARPPGDNADNDESSRELSCAYCKTTYFSRVELAKHMRLSCPLKHKCTHCARTYLNSEALREHKMQCARDAHLRGGLSKRTFKCKNCFIDFKDGQTLQWHEQACTKVYTADLAGKVEEIVQRTLTCAVCGMVSQEYENKVIHEKRCLQRYLIDAGMGPAMPADKDTFSDIDPYQRSLPEDLSSLADSDDAEVDAQKVAELKKQHGATKELDITLNRAADDVVSKMKQTLYQAPMSDAEILKKLRTDFGKLVDRLITDEELREDFVEGEKPEDVLEKMLRHLGEEPVQFASGTSELVNFKHNLQTFLRLAIKAETLEKANHKAESIEEALHNLLHFPYELQ